jgi:hypothetical protein
VAWSEADNEAWLADLKRRAGRLPDSILRTARAERLRKETNRLQVTGNEVTLTVDRGGEGSPHRPAGWPRSITIGEQIGLTRLSGHSFYELAWQGGLHVRRFEISGTTRRRVPFEHIELALGLAETLAMEQELTADPVTPAEVEAAYLRRLKARRAEFGPPSPALTLPEAIRGRPVVSYRLLDLDAVILHGDQDWVYATAAGSEAAVLLQQEDRRQVLAALTMVRGRPQRGQPLMTTPLAELDLSTGGWLRAIAAWAAWLARVTSRK